MPFPDRTFDWSLLALVLHRTADPVTVLAEAARVAKRLIVFEGVIKNRWHSQFTGLYDNLVNLEFSGNPHNNKTESEWHSLFGRLGLRVQAKDRIWTNGLFCLPILPGPIWQHVYVLDHDTP